MEAEAYLEHVDFLELLLSDEQCPISRILGQNLQVLRPYELCAREQWQRRGEGYEEENEGPQHCVSFRLSTEAATMVILEAAAALVESGASENLGSGSSAAGQWWREANKCHLFNSGLLSKPFLRP